MRTIRAISVVLLFCVAMGVTVYGCKRAEKSTFPDGVQTIKEGADFDATPDHLVIVSFGADESMIKDAARKYAGKAEFFSADGNEELMMQQGVEVIPTVLFIKPGGEVGERLAGEIDGEELSLAIDRQLD